MQMEHFLRVRRQIPDYLGIFFYMKWNLSAKISFTPVDIFIGKSGAKKLPVQNVYSILNRTLGSILALWKLKVI